MLAQNPYDAGQRALWHLEKIGSIIDCSYAVSLSSFGNDLSLVYAVPKISKTMSDSQFPHKQVDHQHLRVPKYSVLRIAACDISGVVGHDKSTNGKADV